MKPVWIVEFRRNPRSRWEPEKVYETRGEAEECRRETVTTGELRIMKYVRVEKKDKP